MDCKKYPGLQVQGPPASPVYAGDSQTQSVEASEASGLVEPAGHVVQAAEPVEALYSPAAQATHEAPPVLV